MAKKEDHGFHFYLDAETNTLPANKANVAATGLKQTCKVGSYPPNRLGLHDMHDDVWEMCGDADGLKPTTFRGGSWGNDGTNQANEWEGLGPTTRGNEIGLRLARVPVAVKSDAVAEKGVLDYAEIHERVPVVVAARW